MESIRQQRVQELILRELGDFLRIKNIEWCNGMMLTVTKVKVSKDLSFAKVYISIFGQKDHKATLDIIKLHAKEIRYNLGLKIGSQLRVVPELAFFEDDSLDYIENIDKLLNG